MKKVFKAALFIVVVTVVIIVAVGFFLPSSYVVEKEITIQATPAAVHVFVDDLTKWPEWGPWQEEDPSIVTTLGAITAGVGAHQSWSGDSGSGELTFTASDPASGVQYDLSFDDGKFLCVSAVRYIDRAGATKVTWSMRGDVGNNLLGRYFALFSDSLVGPMFTRGLEKLKASVEGS